MKSKQQPASWGFPPVLCLIGQERSSGMWPYSWWTPGQWRCRGLFCTAKNNHISSRTASVLKHRNPKCMENTDSNQKMDQVQSWNRFWSFSQHTHLQTWQSVSQIIILTTLFCSSSLLQTHLHMMLKSFLVLLQNVLNKNMSLCGWLRQACHRRAAQLPLHQLQKRKQILRIPLTYWSRKISPSWLG